MGFCGLKINWRYNVFNSIYPTPKSQNENADIESLFDIDAYIDDKV